ncbi:hypothetical protein Ahy_B08g092103 isoform E [Arachis hypogaea]|uniref:MEKHLA domain-containing protein n=1 Tax=Arachis hypogaea TaxID=3818 RepID=A0A444Y370_ARAHY|nr:hypothetical protein Ahy_B08g092103 isoform E [Arachis hypogaea]
MAMLRKLLPRRKSILTDIAEAKYNYWSTFAANPFEVVLVAGKKAKLPGGGDEEENKCDLKDLTGEGNIESMLFFKQGLRELASLKASPVFIFANQAELDMLETTLVALQDIMLNKVLDESGKKILCSEFSKIMQQLCSSSGSYSKSWPRRMKRAGSKLKSRIIAEQFIHKWSHDENMITHKEEIFSRSKRTWFVTETEKKVATKAAKKNFPRKRRKLEAAREMLEDEGDDDRPEVCTSCLHLRL